MSAKVSSISERRRKPAVTELSDEALAVLVRDLALAEENTLQELCAAVLNDDVMTAKRLAGELRCDVV